MERVFRTMAVAVVVMLTGCRTVEANQAFTTAPDPAVAISARSAAGNPAVAAEIRDVLPAGANVLALSQGDINTDGRLDVVVALDGTPGDPAGAQAARSLLLLVRDGNGYLQLAARNDRIVPCAACGGSLGAPSIELTSDAGSFTLRTEGGTGWLWANEYSFEYRNTRWLLASISRMSTHRTTHETRESVRTADEFGPIDFVDFDPEATDETLQREE